MILCKPEDEGLLYNSILDNSKFFCYQEMCYGFMNEILVCASGYWTQGISHAPVPGFLGNVEFSLCFFFPHYNVDSTFVIYKFFL